MNKYIANIYEDEKEGEGMKGEKKKK